MATRPFSLSMGFPKRAFSGVFIGENARGIRVTVAMIVGEIASGKSIERLVFESPYLEREDIQQAVAAAAKQILRFAKDDKQRNKLHKRCSRASSLWVSPLPLTPRVVILRRRRRICFSDTAPAAGRTFSPFIRSTISLCCLNPNRSYTGRPNIVPRISTAKQDKWICTLNVRYRDASWPACRTAFQRSRSPGPQPRAGAARRRSASIPERPAPLRPV